RHAMAVMGFLLLSGCSRAGDSRLAHPIPGTEQLAVEQFCITVSPDEKWLTFVEWMLPDDQRVKSQARDAYSTRITSLNLLTGARTRHSIDELSPQVFGLPSDRQDWISSGNERIAKEWFRPPGWVRGLFYFQKNVRGATLALDPSQREIRTAAVPDTLGTCSDCPPGTSVAFGGRMWDLLAEDVSAVVRDGKVRVVYCWGSRPNRRNAILRVGENGDQTVVVERPQETGTMVAIATLRVSPDDRYLAYVVHAKKQAILAGPSEELFVRQLQTGKEERIASHGAMGNLIWSRDGERLYFAGSLLGGDGMTYVVDIERVFHK
ncbi:MAG TPA: hypothetical protein VJS69_02220, partial [Candidatus Krumholzibacteria bacterium]|nr:hypothetical protein [Candidatus Krumholzibacteria bacterium]